MEIEADPSPKESLPPWSLADECGKHDGKFYKVSRKAQHSPGQVWFGQVYGLCSGTVLKAPFGPVFDDF